MSSSHLPPIDSLSGQILGTRRAVVPWRNPVLTAAGRSVIVPAAILFGSIAFQPAAADSIVFSGQSMETNGSALLSSDELVLTPDLNSQAGSAYGDTADTFTEITSFSTEFSFQINGNTNGADGLTFSLQNDATGNNALGSTGHGLGLIGVTPSFAVAFDTWDNTGGVAPGASDINLYVNGDTLNPIASVTSPFDLNAGTQLYSKVDYNSTSKLLDVYISNTNTFGATPTLSTVVTDLGDNLGGQAFSGFTAATGGASNEHKVLQWSGLSTTHTVPTFDGIEIDLNGDARIQDGTLILTPDQTSKAGSAFKTTPDTFTETTSFSTDFSFQIDGSSLGADGVTFTLQNDAAGSDALGLWGAGIGVDGVTPSISVAFDTWDNTGGVAPGASDINLYVNGDTLNPIASVASPFDLNAGTQLYAKVDYNSTSKLLDVFISNTNIFGATPTLSTVVTDLGDNLGGQAFSGFTAATGGASNEHMVLQWSGLSTAEVTPVFDGIEVDLNGSARIHNGSLILTPDQTSKAGSAFTLAQEAFTSTTSFATNFSFQITGENWGSDGADGLAFVLQDGADGSDALGLWGGGVGLAGILPSFAVAFDTWGNNGGGFGANDINVYLDGDTLNPFASVVAPFDINNGDQLFAWVIYDGLTDLLEVFLNDTDVLPGVAALSLNYDLFALLGGDVHLGFTSGTGGASNQHEILSWSYAMERYTPAPTPGALHLFAVGLMAMAGFTWRRRAHTVARAGSVIRSG